QQAGILTNSATHPRKPLSRRSGHCRARSCCCLPLFTSKLRPDVRGSLYLSGMGTYLPGGGGAPCTLMLPPVILPPGSWELPAGGGVVSTAICTVPTGILAIV